MRVIFAWYEKFSCSLGAVKRRREGSKSPSAFAGYANPHVVVFLGSAQVPPPEHRFLFGQTRDIRRWIATFLKGPST